MAYDFLTSSQEKIWHMGDESSLPKTCVTVGADQGVNPCYATGDMLDRMPDKMSFTDHALALKSSLACRTVQHQNAFECIIGQLVPIAVQLPCVPVPMQHDKQYICY